MRFARASFIYSFRFRVMAGLCIVVVLTMVVTTVLVRAVVQPSILLAFDEQLLDEANETIESVRVVFPDGIPTDWSTSLQLNDLLQKLERRSKSRGHLRWFIRLLDSRNQTIFESENFPPIPIPAPGGREDAVETGGYRWVDVAAPGRIGGADFHVQVCRSNQALIEDFDLLDRTLYWRGLFAIVLAPLGGYIMARQVTGPIATIISTASRLQPQQLAERLPIRGTDDELDQVSKTINVMLDRIATYIDKNRAFVANAAHELRSPLAAMRTSAEVALNRSRSPEEYANVLHEIIEEVGRLTSMVNRLLLLAESDAGGLIPASGKVSRLDSVILEAIEMFQAVAETVGVEIRPEIEREVEVPGGEASLRHLVRNLLDNAIKFSPPNSVVVVALRTDTERRQAIFTVVDRGIGIPPEDLPRLFERFFRGDRSRHRTDGRSGSGLGLSICQAVTEGMGGEIRVASALGKGTTFTVTLPLAESRK